MIQNKQSSLVLLQSRLSSNRLPCKALLPVSGLPMVVLAAKRAANTGRKVIVLTSEDQTDDAICEVLDDFKIDFFRGSLNDVLKRFNDALIGFKDNTKVFRLTADNVLPDGALLDEMEAAFIASGADIMGCDPEKSMLPYGVSAELTTARWIRAAHKNVSNSYDKEHVTPYIYRNGVSDILVPHKLTGHKNLRVTIDSFDDYISVKSLFDGAKDSINAEIESLISNYQNMKYHPFFEASTKPMTLGGAQFGLHYGITNTAGKVPKSDSIQIIRHAITEGIKYIDTAAAYGESEKIIGEALRAGWSDRVKIITKLLPLGEDDLNQSTDAILSFQVRNSILKSCINLNTAQIDTLMLHRAEHLKNDVIFNELLKIKEEGLIQNIGASVQSPQELKFVLSNKDVSIIQMPYNIIDNRWDSIIDEIQNAREKRGLIIHARSALLQGLLCSEDKKKWDIAQIKNSKEINSWLNKKYKEHEKISISDLCIGYVNSQDWIDSVVIGVDSIDNLLLNLKSISKESMKREMLNDLVASRPIVNSDSLDPSNWKYNV